MRLTRLGARISARAGVTTVFFVNGAMFATWASRIPAVSHRVGASTGALGLTLLAPAVAALVTMPIVGRLLPGRSSRTFCRVAVAGTMVALVLPGLVQSVPALAGALLAVGVANSALDLSMNAQGVSVERAMKRPILSSLHAAYSFGGFAGAGLGALAAALSVAPFPQFAVASVVFGVPALIATIPMLARDEDVDAHAPAMRWQALPSRLIVLGIACLFCLMAEGGSSDWSAKLVHDDLGGSAALGAIAYAVFSIGMGTGRLMTDRLWARWGAVGLLRRCGALAAVGFAAGLAIGTAPAAIAGVRCARARARRRRPDAVPRRRRSARRLHGVGARGGYLAWLPRVPRRSPADRRHRAAHVAAAGGLHHGVRGAARRGPRAGRRGAGSGGSLAYADQRLLRLRWPVARRYGNAMMKGLAVTVAAVCALLLAGCGGSSAPALVSPAARSAGLRLVRVGVFAQPTYVTGAPGDGQRLFVVEKRGVIVVAGERPAALAAVPRHLEARQLERGGAGAAVDGVRARLRQSGRFYVDYTGKNGDLHIVQYRRAAGDPNVAGVASARAVLTIPHHMYANHNGGQLQFGPDGDLYIGVGDGGNEDDPMNDGQNTDRPARKDAARRARRERRLHDPGRQSVRRRGRPAPEIWAYGLRNPWRFSFDRLTGRLIIGDVGQDQQEEVDFAPRGTGAAANYGWSIFEGDRRNKPGQAPGAVFPVLVTHPQPGVLRDHRRLRRPGPLGSRFVWSLCVRGPVQARDQVGHARPRPRAPGIVAPGCPSATCRRSARTRSGTSTPSRSTVPSIALPGG